MKIASIVLACSTLASLVGCTVRDEAPRRTIVREEPSCGRHQHWNGRFCADDHRDRDTTVIIDTRK
jgi:hypothetical protein